MRIWRRLYRRRHVPQLECCSGVPVYLHWHPQSLVFSLSAATARDSMTLTPVSLDYTRVLTVAVLDTCLEDIRRAALADLAATVSSSLRLVLV